jgi:exonuclease III
MNYLDKWTRINYTLRKNKIAILALQETHLNDEMAESIKRCFGKNFDLLYSSNTNNPCSKAGVAFVLNKALIPNRQPKIHILAPGRAIMLKIRWPDDKEIKIINVYAPVQDHKQPAFWVEVEGKHQTKHLPRPDFLLRDFNITEDLIDRSPLRADNQSATDSLRDIRLTWEVQDQWRHTHPNDTLFTY